MVSYRPWQRRKRPHPSLVTLVFIHVRPDPHPSPHHFCLPIWAVAHSSRNAGKKGFTLPGMNQPNTFNPKSHRTHHIVGSVHHCTASTRFKAERDICRTNHRPYAEATCGNRSNKPSGKSSPNHDKMANTKSNPTALTTEWEAWGTIVPHRKDSKQQRHACPSNHRPYAKAMCGNRSDKPRGKSSPNHDKMADSKSNRIRRPSYSARLMTPQASQRVSDTLTCLSSRQ